MQIVTQYISKKNFEHHSGKESNKKWLHIPNTYNLYILDWILRARSSYSLKWLDFFCK